MTHEITKLVKYSPHREGIFQELKTANDAATGSHSPGVHVLWPTTWTVCADSLASIIGNYAKFARCRFAKVQCCYSADLVECRFAKPNMCNSSNLLLKPPGKSHPEICTFSLGHWRCGLKINLKNAGKGLEFMVNVIHDGKQAEINVMILQDWVYTPK